MCRLLPTVRTTEHLVPVNTQDRHPSDEFRISKRIVLTSDVGIRLKYLVLTRIMAKGHTLTSLSQPREKQGTFKIVPAHDQSAIPICARPIFFLLD